MKNVLFILCGEAFSGKSTLAKKLAKQFDAKILGRDEIYFAIADNLALEETPEDEDDQLWFDLWPVALQGVRNQLRLGINVVFDDTTIRKRERDDLRSIANQAGAKSILIFLNTSELVQKTRHQENRKTNQRHDVPSGWLKNDSEEFEKPMDDEKPIIINENTNLDELIKKLSIYVKYEK